MRTVNEVFTDEEHAQLKKAKGKKTWHDFILELTQKPANQIKEQING